MALRNGHGRGVGVARLEVLPPGDALVYKNGRLIVDDPFDLPDGTVVDVIPVNHSADAEREVDAGASLWRGDNGRGGGVRAPGRGRQELPTGDEACCGWGGW